MLIIKEAVIVEGKYDKIKLSNIIDGLIITTSGFGIYNDPQLRLYISKLAEQRGIIILTDSDSSGFKIRNYIKSFVPAEKIKNVYIPDIIGKEKRKTKHSAENKIGVEGIDDAVIESIFRKEDISILENSYPDDTLISKADFYRLGLSGKPFSKERRKKIQDYYCLPESLSANELINYLNSYVTAEEFTGVCNELGFIDIDYCLM